MNKAALVLAFFLFQLSLVAQKGNKPVSQAIKIPMEAVGWSFAPGTCEFLQHKSLPAMRMLTSKDTAILKDFRFTNGTVEYDIEPEDDSFTGFFFRRQNS